MNAPAPVNQDTPLDSESPVKASPEMAEGEVTEKSGKEASTGATPATEASKIEKPSKKTKKKKSESKESEEKPQPNGEDTPQEPSSPKRSKKKKSESKDSEDKLQISGEETPQEPSSPKRSKKKKSESKDSEDKLQISGEETPQEPSSPKRSKKKKSESKDSEDKLQISGEETPQEPSSPKRSKKKKSELKDSEDKPQSIIEEETTREPSSPKRSKKTKSESKAKKAAPQLDESGKEGETTTSKPPAEGAVERTPKVEDPWAAPPESEEEKGVPNPENEKDEAVRLAMEAANAAKKHSKLSTAEIRKLMDGEAAQPAQDTGDADAPPVVESGAAEQPLEETADDADAGKPKPPDLPEPDTEEDEEVRLAMEMAIAAAKHPHLSPQELQKLVGEKNSQAKIVEELARKLMDGEAAQPAQDTGDADAPPVMESGAAEQPGETVDDADAGKHKPPALPEPDTEEDEEVRLAMEMAIAAAKHPHLSPQELQKLVGEKNAQAKIVEELAGQKEEKLKLEKEKLKLEQEKEKEESARAWQARKDSWWAAAAKKAEEIKDQAERHLYADQIKKDGEIIEMRKQFKVLKKTLKAHRLQGNRVETRHAFKRQRMEKKLMQTETKLRKTQKLFTHSSYNVQEYLKAMMKASKKWRKVGTDEELMLEAQLCRNMHQMLALEKQKVKSKKNTKEMKKYLQRCKGWLSDKKAFCEMNLMTLEATQHSMTLLYEDTLRRQDALIEKLKASDEFKNVDLSNVDLSHVKLPNFPPRVPDRSSAMDALRGLPIKDSIRVKKDHIGMKEAPPLTPEEKAAQEKALEEARTRQQLINQYHMAKKQQQQQGNLPDLYVDTKDECSVSSRLSDPDASFNHGEQGSDSNIDFGQDAPWNVGTSNSANLESVEESDDDDDEKKPAARNLKPAPSEDPVDKKPAAQEKAAKKVAKEDAGSTDSETLTPSVSRDEAEAAVES